MTEKSKGGDLFIVDNSISGWTGSRYLYEWCDLAESMDIATGYFEIGSLLELDGKWQQLDKIRILMGDETTLRTKRALLEALKAKASESLDSSLEREKDANPFLTGVEAIVDALKSGQIECRVYNKSKFHAKCYITHARSEVIGSRALAGSSNFTKPGLTDNIELNIQIQSSQEVAELQHWFEEHWQEGEDITEDILGIISRHTQAYRPFDVYAKSLQEFFRGHEMTDSEWEDGESQMFDVLDRYQKEAYWALMKIARQHGGAFLCDGVGLGKTFVGLMLIERLVLRENKRVLLFAPKGAKEGVWERDIKTYLSHIGGVGGAEDFSNLAVFSHTDLSRAGDFPERFKRIADLADAVVIDEAHHFRNPGKQGKEGVWEDGSRYWRLFDILNTSKRPKLIFMLTATPINNRLADFRHMIELFSRRDESYFARNLGINNLRAHFNRMDKQLRSKLGDDTLDLGEVLPEATDFLAQDQLFQELVVQRSRAYARESQLQETGSAASFPERKPPKVADYSVRKSYGKLLDMFEKAFEKNEPLFSLPIYYPLAYYIGDDESIDPFEEGRQRQVVGLIRTMFLKRFESSVKAFEMSCDRLMRKLLAFLEVNSESEQEKSVLERWKRQHADVLDYVYEQQIAFWEEESSENEDAEDVIPPELLEAATYLNRSEYNVPAIMQDTYLDLDQITEFLDETSRFESNNDDKLKKLKRLLKSKDLEERKVLIFTEFADTARYLHRELLAEDIEGLEQLDGSSTKKRSHVIERFSPYYNGSSSAELEDAGLEEIRVLISTDILSEGLNLQDATRLINYDIHWNPVRLMQRIGRVDRRLNPDIEKRLVRDHPNTKDSRGRILFWNFLPPEEINSIFSLYQRVTQKALLISETLGIEHGKLLRPDDDYNILREFNHSYAGTKSRVEEMHLEYQQLLIDDPGLEERLSSLPLQVFSGRKKLKEGHSGVFFCYRLPALDKEIGEFTHEAGTTSWYLYDKATDILLEGPGDIVTSIRSKPGTSRKCVAPQDSLIDARSSIQKHIKDTYLKRVDAPLGVEPILHCWMELVEDEV